MRNFCPTKYEEKIIFIKEVYQITGVDECTDGTHDCDVNAECSNTDGNFTCACKTGYERNGKDGNCKGGVFLFFGISMGFDLRNYGVFK